MSKQDVYDYLKVRPNESFSNNELAKILNCGLGSIGRATKHLARDGSIAFDLHQPKVKKYHEFRKYYCNENRLPLLYLGQTAVPYVCDEHMSQKRKKQKGSYKKPVHRMTFKKQESSFAFSGLYSPLDNY